MCALFIVRELSIFRLFLYIYIFFYIDPIVTGAIYVDNRACSFFFIQHNNVRFLMPGHIIALDHYIPHDVLVLIFGDPYWGLFIPRDCSF